MGKSDENLRRKAKGAKVRWISDHASRLDVYKRQQYYSGNLYVPEDLEEWKLD